MAVFLEYLIRKLHKLHWPLLSVVAVLSCMGLLMLYDAAGGSIYPYAIKQLAKFIIGMMIVFMLAMLDIKILFRYSYFIYFLALLLLVLVTAIGDVGMGAQRWIDLKIFKLQPSEIAKIGLVLAIAHFYQTRSTMTYSMFRNLFLVAGMVFSMVGLVVIQPDLGTSMVLLFIGVGMMFVAGVDIRIFLAGGLGAVVSMPVAWSFLHEYQKNRLLVFWNPETDPAGAGYHIIQSKIAIGSAGFWGKGFMQGTQSHLQFLPEKHTDFIFTLLTEDFGMFGALVLLTCYALIIGLGMRISYYSQSTFAKLMAAGAVLMIFIHAIINMAMVMGLMPVVGIPLPFVSYGGTSMLTMLMAIGLLMNAYVHREQTLPGGTGLSSGRF